MVTATPEIRLGRQPIMDRQHRVVAYELLFRATGDGLPVSATQATAQVISHAFGDLGIGGALGESECYINLGKALLLSDLIELLPKERVVLEILEDVVPDAQLAARCRELRELGFRLALDDFVYAPEYEVLFDYVDIIKVDLLNQDLDAVVAMRRRLPGSLKLLAEKVENHMDYEICLNNGYELFQGFYFARPHVLRGRRHDPRRESILRLIGLLASDAETSDLARVFKQEAALCYKLVRLVNSVGIGARGPIGGITEAITLLGRKQLQRWLQILLFAETAGMRDHNPILETAAQRGKLMDGLARRLRPEAGEFHDLAFMTGLFSLLDALLELSLADALDDVRIQGEARRAILRREGPLGLALRLCEALEAGEFNLAGSLAEQLGIRDGELAPLQVAAMRWSGDLGRAMAGLH